jgi:small subunit ribosomal protein S3
VGQKVNAIGFRLGITRTWASKWYAEKNYREWLLQDLAIKKTVKDKMKSAGISRVLIERSSTKCTVNVYTARPGIIIGKKGQGAEQLKNEVQELTDTKVYLNIHEVRKAETDAQLVAENVASQLVRRVSFRRAMKKAVQTTMKFGAKGIRLNASGRLGGAEMSRREWYREGRVPLHTLRAEIDYGYAIAETTYGVIGVQVWIYTGDKLKEARRTTR